MTTSNLGVFYICYKEKTAIEKSIASFRQFYPDSPIYLSSDGGYNYGYLEANDKFIKTSLDPEQTVGITKDIEKMIATQKFDIVNLFMASIEYLKRLKKAVDYCGTEYMLLMEPDVFVRGKLNLVDIPLVGPKPNVMPQHIQQYFVDNGGMNNVAWGAASGVMKTWQFNMIYNDLINKQHKMLEYLYLDPRIACYDYLLTFLFSIYGYEYAENPDLTECGRNPNWQTSGHPLIHQYYENYVSGSGDTGKHHSN